MPLYFTILSFWLAGFAALWLMLQWRSHVRPFLRKYRDWERATLFALATCLLLVLVLSCWGAAHDPASQDHWLFNGIEVVFQVFEGDSDAFRAYAAFCPLLPQILSWLIPLLTVVTALSLLWNYLPHHVPWGAKVWYIFSELDANSIRMAKSLNTPDSICIFLRTRRGKQGEDQRKELQEINHFLYPRDEARFLLWPWRGRKTLRFFFLSENTDENFNRMNDLLDAVRKKDLFKPLGETVDDRFQQELYLLSETESASMLIDHLRHKLKDNDKKLPVFRNTELRLLDRFRATSYDLLRKQPLYRHVRDGKLHVLVLGFGRIGREFFRTAASMGVIHNCATEFTLCDLEIGRKLNVFLSQCPELRHSVTFYPKTLDADTTELDELVTALNYHYIVVALGEDERNIRVASRLKRHYRLCHWEYEAGQRTTDIQPQICVNLEDPIKRSYTEGLWEEKFTGDHDLWVFGGLDHVFTQAVLMPQDLWKAARWIHRKLNKIDPQTPLPWEEYERRSSIACAAHAAYHVEAAGAEFDEILANWDPEDARCAALADTEHRRWMAYVRSEGLRRVSLDLIDVYYDNRHGRHVDILGKLTPCLVDTKEELGTVWDHLTANHRNDYEGKQTFRQRDEVLVRSAKTVANLAEPDKYPTQTPTT